MMEEMRPIRYILLLLAVALIVAGCGSDDPEAGGDRASTPPAPSAEPGGANQGGKQDGDQAKPEDGAPDFTVETFEGDTFRLSEHSGVPVVLNFWESW
jgi:hypothetical protein